MGWGGLGCGRGQAGGGWGGRRTRRGPFALREAVFLSSWHTSSLVQRGQRWPPKPRCRPASEGAPAPEEPGPAFRQHQICSPPSSKPPTRPPSCSRPPPAPRCALTAPDRARPRWGAAPAQSSGTRLWKETLKLARCFKVLQTGRCTASPRPGPESWGQPNANRSTDPYPTRHTQCPEQPRGHQAVCLGSEEERAQHPGRRASAGMLGLAPHEEQAAPKVRSGCAEGLLAQPKALRRPESQQTGPQGGGRTAPAGAAGRAEDSVSRTLASKVRGGCDTVTIVQLAGYTPTKTTTRLGAGRCRVEAKPPPRESRSGVERRQ